MVDSQEKAKLAWRCRRGMLELDLILNRFLNTHFDHLSTEEIQFFNLLLNSNDPELYAWLMEHEEPQNEELKKIVTLIRTSY